MKPFAYARPTDVHEAVRAVSTDPAAVFLAGGTNLVDHLKLGLCAPDVLVDVRRLTSAEIDDLPDGGLRIGAAVTNSALAADHRVRDRFPVLAQAVLAGASGQLRNAATTGGNPLQRTRCVYFQDLTTACNKREPGTGCAAIGGHTRNHAILGASRACIATHPSDMAVALAALDARVQVLGVGGTRTIAFTDLHRLPEDTPEQDTVLARGDLITAIDLPPAPAGAVQTYRKVRDRASYAFALVSVAAVLTITGGAITDVRLAFGGAAHKPWRATIAENQLRGGPASLEAFGAAVDAELAAATAQDGLDGGNAFKIPLLARTTVATLRDLAGLES